MLKLCVSTSSIIDQLIHFIVRRGVLVTLIQSLLLITFHAAPDEVYWWVLSIQRAAGC